MSVGDRLAALSVEHDLPPGATEHLVAVLGLLATDPEAPSAVVGPEVAVDVHVADSLSGLAVPTLRHAGRIADLGSGAGFPGLVLACALPRAEVHLVDASARRGRYLARAVDAAGAANAHVTVSRVEEWEFAREQLDVAVVRAVAPLAVLVEYAAPLLRLGGTLVSWKGARDTGEEAAGARAAAEVGLEPAGVIPVHPFPSARHRHLHMHVKRAPTPPGFPRRPGMAVKRPLGSDRARR